MKEYLIIIAEIMGVTIIASLIPISLYVEGEEGEEIAKAALYLVHDGSTLT